MLRIIVRTDNADMAANVGGAVLSEFKTFEVSAPEIEAFLRQRMSGLSHRQVVGVEVTDDVLCPGALT